MRKFVAYIIAVFIGAVACVNKTDVYDPVRQITFQPAKGNMTKVVDDLVYPTDIPFIVWAYASSILIDGQEVSFSDGCWTAANDYYWPSAPQTTDFYAWSPSDAPAEFSLNSGVSFNGFNINRHSDFLYARPVTGASKPAADIPVSLIFETPLSEVEFHVYASAEDNVTIWLTGIDLLDINTVGDFSLLPYANWSALSEPVDETVFEGKQELSDKPVIAGEATLVIPQHIRPVVHYMYMRKHPPYLLIRNLISRL